MADEFEGMELDDCFRLVKQIGEGGMGKVFEAEDLALDRMIAIKLVAGRGDDPELKKRFVKEIKAAAKIEHPNLVPVFRAGFDKGLLYMAMRLIKGSDLARILVDGQLDQKRALKIFEDAAAALQCIHEAGYAHRDVKPANILVAAPGKATEYALLGDLGIAKALDDPAGITKGQPPGTPLYMAPETFEHWITDARSDQYSLACVLFEMLSGQAPFSGDSAAEIAEKHMEEEAPDIAAFNPAVPDSVRAALKRALCKEPGKRFSSIAEFCKVVFEEDDGNGERRLTPVEISRSLFGLAPDRDERASQLAMETFLTLWANGYKAPEGDPSSPKRRNGALRSLVVGENFLEGFKDSAQGRRAETACQRLADGSDFSGSEGMALACSSSRAVPLR